MEPAGATAWPSQAIPIPQIFQRMARPASSPASAPLRRAAPGRRPAGAALGRRQAQNPKSVGFEGANQADGGGFRRCAGDQTTAAPRQAHAIIGHQLGTLVEDCAQGEIGFAAARRPQQKHAARAEGDAGGVNGLAAGSGRGCHRDQSCAPPSLPDDLAGPRAAAGNSTVKRAPRTAPRSAVGAS